MDREVKERRDRQTQKKWSGGREMKRNKLKKKNVRDFPMFIWNLWYWKEQLRNPIVLFFFSQTDSGSKGKGIVGGLKERKIWQYIC